MLIHHNNNFADGPVVPVFFPLNFFNHNNQRLPKGGISIYYDSRYYTIYDYMGRICKLPLRLYNITHYLNKTTLCNCCIVLLQSTSV